MFGGNPQSKPSLFGNPATANQPRKPGWLFGQPQSVAPYPFAKAPTGTDSATLFGYRQMPTTAPAPETYNSNRFAFGNNQNPPAATTFSPPDPHVLNCSPATTLQASTNTSSTDIRFLCASCNNQVPAGEIYRCPACKSLYHPDCISTHSWTGTPLAATYTRAELRLCAKCTPAPQLPSTELPDGSPKASITQRDLQSVEVIDSTYIPRRSARDVTKIRLCSEPDPVNILAEHFSTGVTCRGFLPGDITDLTETDALPIEPRYDIGDPVLPVIPSSSKPDHIIPCKVMARYYNAGPASDDGTDDDEDSTAEAESLEADADEVVGDMDADSVYALFGEKGWFYRIEATSGIDISTQPDACWWHEDRLELELGIDTDDEEDIDDDDRSHGSVQEEIHNDVADEIVIVKGESGV